MNGGSAKGGGGWVVRGGGGGRGASRRASVENRGFLKEPPLAERPVLLHRDRTSGVYAISSKKLFSSCQSKDSIILSHILNSSTKPFANHGTVAEWQNRRFCHAEIRVILDKK